MQKVWFGRIWCMTGRWQLMSLESPVRRPRIVEKVWLAQIYAPYWRGAGVAFTVGPYSLRLGTCRAGIEVDESDDEFYWGDLDYGFDEHLAASLFEGYGEDNRDATFEAVEPESVTALVDERTRQLIAVVHEGGEVEYEKGVLPRVPFPGAP